MNYLQNPRGTGPRIGDTIIAACSGTGPEGIIEWDDEIEGEVIDLDPVTIMDRNGYMPIARVADSVVEVVRRFDE